MPKGQLGFFTVDPATGKITYDFSGHISAQGIDLLAGDSNAPPADRRIRWHQGVMTGPVLGELVTFTPALGSSVTSQWFTRNQAGTLTSGITISQSNAGTGSQVFVFVDSGGTPRTAQIINSAGQSTFLQNIDGGAPVARYVEYGTLNGIPAGATALVFTSIQTIIVALVSLFQVGLVAGVQPLSHDLPAAGVLRIYNNNAFAVNAQWLVIGSDHT